jgi:regulator of replication initiation timing
MGTTNALEVAASRLMSALDQFEDVMEQRLTEEKTIKDLEAQLRSLMAEREQLFVSLEKERRRADRLEAANDEVSDRLGTVIDSVRMIVQTN